MMLFGLNAHMLRGRVAFAQAGGEQVCRLSEFTGNTTRTTMGLANGWKQE